MEQKQKSVLYCNILYCIVLYCTVLYCIVLHCIVLDCIGFIVLHCNVSRMERTSQQEMVGWALKINYLSICHFFWLQDCVKDSTPTGFLEGGCRTLTYASLGFPFHFSLFVAGSLNLWEWWSALSDCHLWRQPNGQHVWLLPFPLSIWRLRPHRLHCLRGWRSLLA